MHRFFVFSLLILSLLLTSCDVSSPEEANEAFLRDSLDDIVIAFNLHHLDEIMQYYDSGFLHNGDEINEVTLDWEIRLNDFEEMKLESISIDFNGDEAIVNCVRRFYNNGIMVSVLNEPIDNGDISYWELYDNEWEIRGNRKQY